MNMTQIIPDGPSLVVLVGPSGSGKSTFAARHFDPHEVISSDAIREELTGDISRQDKNDEVFEAFHSRIEQRIRAGRRAVADATHIRNADRKRTAEIGYMLNVPVIYVVIDRPLVGKMQTAGWREFVRKGDRSLVEAHDMTFNANLKEILSGDGNKWVQMIDAREQEPRVVHPLPRDPGMALYEIQQVRGYNTIRVVSDVHGNYDGLMSILINTNLDDTFLLFLGDVVDYGSHSWLVAETVHKLVSEGRAAMVRGNHDGKIYRYLKQTKNGGEFRGKISHGNDATVNPFKELMAMDPTGAERLREMFISLVEQSPDWIQLGDWMFSHAAVHPDMIDNPLFRAPKNSKLEAFALYGETDGTKDSRGFPTRLYSWMDRLPKGINAVLGHQILSYEAPVIERTQKGSTVVFLDTGSSKSEDGKTGFISTMDFEIEPGRSVPFALNWYVEFGRQQTKEVV